MLAAISLSPNGFRAFWEDVYSRVNQGLIESALDKIQDGFYEASFYCREAEWLDGGDPKKLGPFVSCYVHKLALSIGDADLRADRYNFSPHKEE